MQEPGLDTYIGKTRAAETNAQYPGPGTEFDGFGNYYSSELKHLPEPFLDHAAKLKAKATEAWHDIDKLDSNLRLQQHVLDRASTKAQQYEDEASKDSRLVAVKSLSGFSQLRNLESKKQGEIDKHFADAHLHSGLTDDDLTRAAGQHKGKEWDFWANDISRKDISLSGSE
jgi:hypothetical protein